MPPAITRAIASNCPRICQISRRNLVCRTLVRKGNTALPAQGARVLPRWVAVFTTDLAVGEGDYPVGHLSNGGVVGDDHRGGAGFPVGFFECGQHQNAGSGIECAGGFRSEERRVGKGWRWWG